MLINNWLTRQITVEIRKNGMPVHQPTGVIRIAPQRQLSLTGAHDCEYVISARDVSLPGVSIPETISAESAVLDVLWFGAGSVFASNLDLTCWRALTVSDARVG
ncbi:hypothetical protein ACEN8I_16490 [Polaromonas sp. CT11-55]